jgi:hypothetical protein
MIGELDATDDDGVSDLDWDNLATVDVATEYACFTAKQGLVDSFERKAVTHLYGFVVAQGGRPASNLQARVLSDRPVGSHLVVGIAGHALGVERQVVELQRESNCC